jgi:riboflavin synthase
MFTGIVTDVGRVREIMRRGDARLVIDTGLDTTRIAPGASIACAGACLTVVEAGAGRFAVEASAETLARTTLGGWRQGTPVNLERALALGDELGGHLVSGHVDGTTEVLARNAVGNSLAMTFALPGWLAPYVAEKGSVALDGVSLTVNEVRADRFAVNLIPYTRAHTTLGELGPGDRVNVEIDMIARYARRALAYARPETEPA